MIDGSVLQSVQRCFEKKSRVVVKMVVKLGTLQQSMRFHYILWNYMVMLLLSMLGAVLTQTHHVFRSHFCTLIASVSHHLRDMVTFTSLLFI